MSHVPAGIVPKTWKNGRKAGENIHEGRVAAARNRKLGGDESKMEKKNSIDEAN